MNYSASNSRVLRQRIIVTCKAEAQAVTTDAIIKKVFNAVPVP